MLIVWVSFKNLYLKKGLRYPTDNLIKLQKISNKTYIIFIYILLVCRAMPVLSNTTFLPLPYAQGASMGIFYKVGISLLLGHGFILCTIGVLHRYVSA